MTLKVQDQSSAVQAMAEKWPIVNALMGGTASMRRAGVSLLPKWPNEEQDAYSARLATATLFPAYKRTVGVMAGKPFSKQITLSEDTPQRIKDLCEDVDQEGRNLHAFASEKMLEVMGWGIAGVLVDYPAVGEAIKTKADEEKTGVRPYFVSIRHDQVLGWQASIQGGVTRLLQLRIMEQVDEPDGDYGTKPVNQVRVLTPGAWAIYREVKGATGSEYALFADGTTTLSEIPYVPFYGQRTGFMQGASPLEDLGYLNIKHWQSQSDQDTILHAARVPILAMIGFDEQSQLTVGASSAVKLPMGADMKFVEHTGSSISAGAESLVALESQMIQTGAELLVQKPGSRTATESNNDAEANKSDLQRIVENFEDSVDQCLQFMADWIKLPEGGHSTLFKDFGASNLTDASAQLILSMQQGGLITKPTAIREQQRRGMLSPDINPDEELAAIEAEGPALGMMGEEDPLAGVSAGTGEDDPSAPLRPASPTAPAPAPAPAPAAPVAPAIDWAPFNAGIAELTNRPDPAPVDFAEMARVLAEAMAKMPAPVVNVPAFPALNLTMPEQQPTVVNIAPAAVTVNTPDVVFNAPDITVNTPAMTVEPAVVNVTTAPVTIEPAQITVNTPEVTVQPAQVSVTAPITVEPAQVTVNVEKPKKVKFTENGAGQIDGAEME